MDQCQVCHLEDVAVVLAVDALRPATLRKAPLEGWVKMCGSCVDLIEAGYGKKEGEAEEEGEEEGEEEWEEEEWEWIPAPLPYQPNLPEDWDIFLWVQDHLPFAEEDDEE